MYKLKIVVLDGYTLNPGDLTWSSFEKLGDVIIYERTPTNMILERCDGADVVLTNKTILDENVLNKLSKLKYIGVLATGYNVVNIEAAKKNNIIVTNIPAYGTNSVVQMTFALLLELSNRVQYHSDSVMSGKWTASKDWCYWDYPLVELAGKTMGIIGFGNIGQKVADVASAFGMKVLVQNRHKLNQTLSENFSWADLDELFEKSDVISIHCPLFPETKGLINRENLIKMKKSAFIINTSRGPIIDEEDLAEALNNDIISGAAIDVLSIEPPKANNPLLKAKNCIITPHIAWATKESRTRLMQIAIDNLSAFLKGEELNRIN